MKTGSFVKLTWRGMLGLYLVKVRNVDHNGVEGSYIYISQSGIQEPTVQNPYLFRWDGIRAIEETTDHFQEESIVDLGDGYKAIISADKKSVKVGCRFFSRDKILEVANKLQE